jgi:hypothetical protein
MHCLRYGCGLLTALLAALASGCQVPGAGPPAMLAAATVETSPARALDVAEALALKRLAETPGVAPEIRAEYAWARVSVEARIHPAALAAEQLKALAGHYGAIEVDFRDGALWMTRSDRPRWPKGALLSPLTAEALFAVEGMGALRVRLTGKALELVWQDDPATETFARR